MKIKKFTPSQSISITTIGSKKDRCTIGYRRINRMIQVSVSYCAPDDQWKAKTGQTIVVQALEEASMYDNANVISLPMGRWHDENIQSMLVEMFFGFAND